jgi:hypothetical protein
MKQGRRIRCGRGVEFHLDAFAASVCCNSQCADFADAKFVAMLPEESEHLRQCRDLKPHGMTVASGRIVLPATKEVMQCALRSVCISISDFDFKAGDNIDLDGNVGHSAVRASAYADLESRLVLADA